MNVVVDVTEAEIRGMPLGQYQSALHNLFGEGYPDLVDDIEIVAAERASFVIDGSEDSPEAQDILSLARQFTNPVYKDGYFG
jgi:hypothetical protein